MRKDIRAVSALDQKVANVKRSLLLASVAAATVGAQLATAASSTVQLNAADGFGQASFNAGTNWGAGSLGGTPAAGAAPSVGAGADTYDYYVGLLRAMRTPTAGSGLTFGGNSLTFYNGGMFFNKGPNGAIYTVNNMTLDAGILANSGGGPFTLNGSINLTNNGGLVWASNLFNGNINVNSTITGSGPLVIGGGTAAAGIGETHSLNASNSYVGNTAILGHRLVLGNSNALPSSTVVTMGSVPVFATDGNAVIDLAGFNASIAGLQVASYSTASATGSVVASFSTFNATIRLNSMPANLAVGQKVSTASGTGYILLIDRTRSEIVISQGTGSGVNGPITSGTSFTFSNAGPTAASQIIGNSSTITDSTLTIKGPNSTTFGGTIQNTLAAGTRTTGVTVAGGSFTLTGANTYSGNTTTNGGVLKLDFSAAGAPANNIINNVANNSVLAVNGGTLSIVGSASAAASQRFNGVTVNGSGTISLTNNGADIAANLNAITRNPGGALDFVNPSGTLSATNGIQTTSGTASSLLTDADGVPYASVGGSTWAVKDSTNAWIEGMSNGTYTPSTSTTIGGYADIVTDTTLTGSNSATTLRFNDSTARTISGGDITTSGILVAPGAGSAAINGGTINGVAGKELIVLQNNTSNSLSIGSSIIDNTSATAFTKAGNGTVVLSGTNNYTGATYVSGGTLQVASQVALYNNTPASWTASNIVVGPSATLALNVGGTGEFTTGDVATIAALGSSTNGFKNGSTLALDTTNASGGSFTHGTSITNTNSGANELNLKKLGSGTLVLGAASSYTGSTTINSGTLQLGASGTLPNNTRVSINSATLDLNNHFTTVGGLSGSGTIALGTGTLTYNSANSGSFDGAITGTGGLTVDGGGSLTVTGTSSYSGTTSVRSGTLSLSSTTSA